MLKTNQTLNYIKLQFYYSEQYINKLIIHDLNHTTLSIFILLFISGIITSINPCTLSILPITLSYMNSNIKNPYSKNTFVIGMVSSFTLFIIFTSILNKYLKKLSTNTPIISSVYMIAIGLSLLEIIQLNLITLNPDKISCSTLENIIKDYITGFLVGLNSFSCSTPILATTIFWVSQSQFTALSIGYIFCYLIGYVSPILILINVTFNYSNVIVIKNIWSHIIPLSGSMMLGLGVLSLLDNMFI